ncbi:MmcQ/YjbR family DNA-binding protein [Parapedobacter tibetensis]|uniref:MmcQ/YjbR family DNA-binding protein n=1 Tax=Parapedobacter tibetensis TaxID=2972951 RepID=UPI00214DD631|nr:MmcQ/YjbR family DNA-binding protein [Parapedobacter tibetensis]
MTTRAFRDLALSFPGTIENPHFDRAAFKVENKRIFASLHEESGTANLKLPEADQSAFCSFGKGAIYPIPNKWGQQGWTTFELQKIPHELMLDALDTAYKDVFKVKPKKKQ